MTHHYLVIMHHPHCQRNIQQIVSEVGDIATFKKIYPDSFVYELSDLSVASYNKGIVRAFFCGYSIKGSCVGVATLESEPEPWAEVEFDPDIQPSPSGMFRAFRN